MYKCLNCLDSGYVCENHPHKPWAGYSEEESACDCGAGMYCANCNKDGTAFVEGHKIIASVYGKIQ